MTRTIIAFQGQYRFLSNFYVDPDTGYSVEALFQAEKCKPGDDMAEQIRVMSPRKAKVAGRKVQLRDDWEQIKVQRMAYWVNQKFTGSDFFTGYDYMSALENTGHMRLVEGNMWHDQFWGVCDCGRFDKCKQPGSNILGVILMTIRETLL